MCDVFERAGIIFDRASVAADVARTGLVRGRLGRVPVDAFCVMSAILDDLERRFG